MAITYEKGVAATAQKLGTKLSTKQLAGRVRVSTDSITLAAAADDGSKIRLAWVPYGATILDGYITHGATTTSVDFIGGIMGCTSTDTVASTYDSHDDIFFAALDAATEAESRSAPKRLQVRLGATDGATVGYKITDPLGANILIEIDAANAPSGSKIQCVVFYVMD
jgi:hypothetical protein